MRRILTVVGARPQFIKASAVSRAIKKEEGLEEILLHTGQHFDSNMSSIFFDQLGIPKPDIQLNIHSGTHGDMTGRMLAEIERVILSEQPDYVLVYGDTNSTLAGALAAAKLHYPVAHVEAGLRSFNMKMPEEINRILTDQLSSILFCPTEASVKNLEQEGFSNKPVKVVNVGDVMQDTALFFKEHSFPPSDFNASEEFILATLHRAENTDDPIRLNAIVDSLNYVNKHIAPVVIPLHPRTRSSIKALGISLDVTVINPVGYLEMIWLLNQCGLVLTDSGGVQKEAFFFGKFCVTMREQTEWVELVDVGANTLVGANQNKIQRATSEYFRRQVKDEGQLYGGGCASERIVKILGKI